MIYDNITMGGVLIHADRKNHKYINKFRTKSGKWRYIYQLSKAASKNGEKFLDIDRRLTNSAMNYLGRRTQADLYKFGEKGFKDMVKNSITNENKKEFSDASKKYEGMKIASRNEAKLEKRENERARRDAATNAGVDNYTLAFLNAKKQVKDILKYANKSAARIAKKRAKKK